MRPEIKSIYRWEGAVQRVTEWQLWIKATSDRLGELTAWLDEHHSYDVPVLERGVGGQG